MGEGTRDRWVRESVAGGGTFAEVGGLWGTVNEQVSVASAGGASSLTMIDIVPQDGPGDELWRAFDERCKELGVGPVEKITGDVNSPEFRSLPRYDVVHCSGVVYHCPHPLFAVQQLAGITERTLILGCATIPERIENVAGVLETAPGSALLVPALGHSQRAVLGQFLDDVGAFEAIGVNAPIRSAWDPQDTAAWWWFPTRDFVSSLLSLTGLEVTASASYWSGRATLYYAERRA